MREGRGRSKTSDATAFYVGRNAIVKLRSLQPLDPLACARGPLPMPPASPLNRCTSTEDAITKAASGVRADHSQY